MTALRETLRRAEFVGVAHETHVAAPNVLNTAAPGAAAERAPPVQFPYPRGTAGRATRAARE